MNHLSMDCGITDFTSVYKVAGSFYLPVWHREADKATVWIDDNNLLFSDLSQAINVAVKFAYRHQIGYDPKLATSWGSVVTVVRLRGAVGWVSVKVDANGIKYPRDHKGAIQDVSEDEVTARQNAEELAARIDATFDECLGKIFSNGHSNLN